MSAMIKSTAFVSFLSIFATCLSAKNINIICTFRGSLDKDGYEELTPSSFSINIVEDNYGNAKSASINGLSGMCSYTEISEYSQSTIMFSGCERGKWLDADEPTPIGSLKIDRYTGEFFQSTEFPHVNNSFLGFVGDCRAGTKKF